MKAWMGRGPNRSLTWLVVDVGHYLGMQEGAADLKPCGIDFASMMAGFQETVPRECFSPPG